MINSIKNWWITKRIRAALRKKHNERRSAKLRRIIYKQTKYLAERVVYDPKSKAGPKLRATTTSYATPATLRKEESDSLTDVFVAAAIVDSFNYSSDNNSYSDYTPSSDSWSGSGGDFSGGGSSDSW